MLIFLKNLYLAFFSFLVAECLIFLMILPEVELQETIVLEYLITKYASIDLEGFCMGFQCVCSAGGCPDCWTPQSGAIRHTVNSSTSHFTKGLMV